MNVDELTGKFAEACWAFKRGETAAKPTSEAYGLHPFLGEAIGRMAGVDIERKPKAQQTMKQQQLL